MSRRTGLGTALVLIMALLMATSPVAMAAPGLASTDGEVDDEFSVDEVLTQSTSDVTIASELEAEANSGETVDVFVRMDATESHTFAEVTGDATPTSDSQAALEQEAEITQAQLELHAERLDGLTIKNEFWITNAVLVEVDTSRVDLDDLARIDGVTELHPNYDVDLVEPQAVSASSGDVSTNQGANYTYGLEQINAPEAWEAFGTRGEGVKAAVIDTGVNPNHEAFDDYNTSNWAAFDFDGNERDVGPHDNNGHGTHVAGTVLGNNASGEHIGVAPDAELLAISVFPEAGGTTLAAIVAGMQKAVDEDADVANLSLGGGGYAGIYIDVIKNAKAAGTHIVSSSGNSGPGSEGTPGNVYNGTAVGATDDTRQVTGFSTGTEIDTAEEWGFIAPDGWPDHYVTPDVSAPGAAVNSAYVGGDDAYAELSGTSMAAPHVTGAVALLMAQDDDLTPTEAKNVLEETATKPYPTDIGPGVQADAQAVSDDQLFNLYNDDVADVRYGYGIIDVYAASLAVAEDANTVAVNIEDDEGSHVTEMTRVTTDDGDRQATYHGAPVEFDVTDGNVTFVATDAFGYSDGYTMVNASETSTATIDVDRQLDLALLSGQPDELEAGDQFDIELDVAHLENVTVALHEQATVDAENVSLELNGDQLDLNETTELGSAYTGPATLTVSVEDGAEGVLGFEHTFEGLNSDSAVAETGPTTVVETVETLPPLEIVEHDTLEEDIISNQMRTGTITIMNPADEPQSGELVWNLMGIGAFDEELTLEPGEEEEVSFSLSYGPSAPAPWGDFFSIGDEVDQELYLVDDEDNLVGYDQFSTELTAGYLSGQVTDADTGEPLGGATVTVTDGFATFQTTTDSTGHYAVNPDFPGEWAVIVESGSYGPAQETVTIDENLTPVEQDVEVGSTPTFELEVTAGETASVGLPADIEGGTVGDMISTDAEAIIWAYDADANEWISADSNTSADALDAFVISANQDTTVTVDFAGMPGAGDTSTPTERDVSAGWNFVAPSVYDEPENAFVSTASEDRVIQIQDETHSQMVPDGGFDGVQTLSSHDNYVNPFAGYFVFVDDDATMAGATHEGMTLTGAYDNLNIDASSLEGQVTSAVTGEPIEGAQVYVAGTSLSAQTADDGSYVIPALLDGHQQEVYIDAEGYEGTVVETGPGTASVALQDEVYFNVTDLEVDPTEFAVGDTFTANYTIENEGNESASQIVTSTFGPADELPRASDDAYELDASVVELEPGETETIEVETTVGDFVAGGDQQVTVYTADDSEAVNVTVTEEGSVDFVQQAAGDDDGTAYVGAEVESNVDSAVVVTYESGEDLTIAGLDTFAADDLDGTTQLIDVEDAGGFPGDHTVHVIPVDALSEEYAPGDTVSAATADAVLDANTSTVHAASVSMDAQEATNGNQDVEVNTSSVDPVPGDGYSIAIHNASDPTEILGYSDVLTADGDNVTVTLDAPLEDETAVFAMLHVAASESDPAGPPITQYNPDGTEGTVISAPVTVTVTE
ncbi:S8 family serine peptidase [Halobacteria archaeon AArc-curdl1]|uniref:S8 family serine peptidase n=1 Tax=Natronosalvus hydrolyticus TaxID=2979988 RepID=A0AAP3E8M7_9EURY|nr:S8 family serine peptidase [Halobacteria archaeon AArc-curdl1]